MIDVGHDVITAVLDKESADKLCRYLKGCRVSFCKHDIEHKEIIDGYEQMLKGGSKNRDIVKALAAQYGKSESWIQRIIQKWKKK